MKNIVRFLLSLALISVFASTFSLAFTGDAKTIFYETAAVLLAIGAIKGLVNSIVPSAKQSGLAYNFVISDTTYAGEAASTFIVKAITQADTINSGSVYVKDGIKKKFTIPRWGRAEYGDLIQDRQATPTSFGTETITGQVIEPADYMIYQEFNPRDFEDQWMAVQLNPTLIDRTLPFSAESVLVQQVLAVHAKFLNAIMWNGDTSLTSVFKYFDGFIQKALDSASTIDVGGPTTLSASNIVAELEKGYVLIPAALKYDPEMKIFVSYKTYDFYQTAIQNQTYKGNDFTTLGPNTYKSLPIVKIADFPDDVYMIARGKADMSSNLWMGMNSVDDEGLQLAHLQANSELYFVKMLMKVDVNCGWFEEVVLYHA